MTIHEAIFHPARQLLLSVLFLILTGWLILIAASFRDGRSRHVKLLYILLFVLSFAHFYLPMLDIAWEINFPGGEKPRPAALAAFGSQPAVMMIAYDFLALLALAASFRELIRYRRNHPTFESIKETMDLLPAGIAFARPDGSIAFCNLTMNRVSRSISGKTLTDLSAFRMALREKAADGPEKEQQVMLPGGSVWQVYMEETKVDGAPYTQLTATDITGQVAVTRKLEEMNAKLRNIRMRLDLYNRQAERIIIAQELLAARMAVHSEVGNVLLESRQYLKNPASFDEEKLLQALKNTNTYLLREYLEDDTEADPLTDVMEMAQIIGVDVVLSGQVPAGEPYRSLLASAIGECASNTVKHAGGDQLIAEIRHADTEITYILRSNGEAPKKPVRESGGLLSLRSLVEKEGGAMLTEAFPSFTLTIRLPKTHSDTH